MLAGGGGGGGVSVATQGHLFSEEVGTDLPLRDNGVHFYYEEDLVLVLRNHGSTVWSSLWRKRKSPTEQEVRG